VALGGCTCAPSPPPFTPPSAAPALSFLDPQGPVAAAQRGLLLVVVLPVLVLAPIFAWRYRYNGSSPYTPRRSFSRPFEFAIWGIPIVIVTVLATWLWHSTKALDPYAPLSPARSSMWVEVVG
jgi:cytochrome o ubiquinol oxidase subunit II